jgi:hypothetical protein
VTGEIVNTASELEHLADRVRGGDRQAEGLLHQLLEDLLIHLAAHVLRGGFTSLPLGRELLAVLDRARREPAFSEGRLNREARVLARDLSGRVIARLRSDECRTETVAAEDTALACLLPDEERRPSQDDPAPGVARRLTQPVIPWMVCLAEAREHVKALMSFLLGEGLMPVEASEAELRLFPPGWVRRDTKALTISAPWFDGYEFLRLNDGLNWSWPVEWTLELTSTPTFLVARKQDRPPGDPPHLDFAEVVRLIKRSMRESARATHDGEYLDRISSEAEGIRASDESRVGSY